VTEPGWWDTDTDTKTQPASVPRRQRQRRRGPRRWRIASAALALAAAAGTVAWLVFATGNSKPAKSTTGVSSVSPVALSSAGLHTIARAVAQRIYWAGPARGHLYELTRTSTGYVYIRYLPHGVKAGAPGKKYLVIGTYPYQGAYTALRASTGKKHPVAHSQGIAVIDPKHATNVRVAYPGVNYEIEVYDPYPRVAYGVATSGVLAPVVAP
jgi:hypothetical protein